MPTEIRLTVDGEVQQPRRFTFDDLMALDATYQIERVEQIDPRRRGAAIHLVGLLDAVVPKASARYLGLHASADDFHASIPLDAVREKAMLIYRLGDGPLPVADGGPTRFFIPEVAQCHTREVDECANVKFVDHIELTADKGFDNRPEDDQQHEALHAQ